MKKILSIFLVAIMIFGLSGCGEETPEQAVKNALEAVKTMDSEKASSYFDYDALLEISRNTIESDEEKMNEMVKPILTKMNYKILSSSQDGNTAQVEAEITNTDMQILFGELFNQAFAIALSGYSEEETDTKIQEIYTELISRDDNETVTKTVNINLHKKDSNWKIDMSDELTDAIFGGLVSYVKNFEESFGAGDESQSDEELQSDEISQ